MFTTLKICLKHNELFFLYVVLLLNIVKFIALHEFTRLQLLLK